MDPGEINVTEFVTRTRVRPRSTCKPALLRDPPVRAAPRLHRGPKVPPPDAMTGSRPPGAIHGWLWRSKSSLSAALEHSRPHFVFHFPFYSSPLSGYHSVDYCLQTAVTDGKTQQNLKPGSQEIPGDTEPLLHCTVICRECASKSWLLNLVGSLNAVKETLFLSQSPSRSG